MRDRGELVFGVAITFQKNIYFPSLQSKKSRVALCSCIYKTLIAWGPKTIALSICLDGGINIATPQEPDNSMLLFSIVSNLPFNRSKRLVVMV